MPVGADVAFDLDGRVLDAVAGAQVALDGSRDATAVRGIAPWPDLAMAAGMVAPWCLAVVSGTGIAPAVAIMEFFVPAAGSMGLDPVRLGTVSALGAHFGRTMSPAAAVVMVC